MVKRLIGPTSRPIPRCSAYPDPTTIRIGTNTWAKTTKTADSATRERNVVGYDTRRRSDGSPCTTRLAWSALPAIHRHPGAARDPGTEGYPTHQPQVLNHQPHATTAARRLRCGGQVVPPSLTA